MIPVFLFNIIISSDSVGQYRKKTEWDSTKIFHDNPDVKIFRSFNDINSKFVYYLTDITNKAITPVMIAAPVGLYIGSRIDNNAYGENSAVLLALSEITSAGVTQGLKILVKRPRPFRTLNSVYLSDTSAVEGSYSFPSGHTSASFSLATSLTLSYPDEPLLIAGLYTYAAITSLGRIYSGVHYPSDVLAGMAIGAGSAALIYSLRKPIIEATNDLFNQSERNDNVSAGNINATAFLLSIAATDFINYYFSNSKNKILRNSELNISTSPASNNLNFSFKF
ncbi:MAG TPA: phosphatase PAP2 family protein [Ignavibacteria bacterium]|nr:phosphatase PAP2 family protein [Ignavibacteria bacterium]HMR39863.1 phosphatase PAP2 family protein [Ignavibacteria bacterium]